VTLVLDCHSDVHSCGCWSRWSACAECDKIPGMAISDVMGVSFVTVSPDATVKEAIGRMVAANVGAVTVCEGPRLVGIFTERDVLRLVSESAHFEDRRVGDVMTRSLVTVPPDADPIAAARLMGENAIRHLPVVEDGNLLGVVGIRDVLSVLVEKLWATHDEEARRRVQELLARTPSRHQHEELSA
jgi:CBS domain-containing protein